MELYKSRSFGDFFQDTFSFIKHNGIHLFKHFLIINGIFLLILAVFLYFFSKFYSDLLFGGLYGQSGTTDFDTYINENGALFFLLVFLFILVALISAVISYAYLPIYMKLYDEHGGKNFGSSQVLKAYTSNIGKLLLFLICGFILGIPLVIALGIILFIFMITIIGMLAIPFIIGGFSLFYQMSLMEYFQNKKGIWESFGYSWNLLTSKFWAAIGSVGLFLLMGYVAQYALAIIPAMISFADTMTSTGESANYAAQDESVGALIFMLSFFFLSFFSGVLINVIVQINQGIVFYGLKEDNENVKTKSIIDQIGSVE